MKLFVASAMSAVAMANDLESIWSSALAKESSIEALEVNQQMMRSAGDDRNVMDLFTLSNIFEYGCWCHFGDSKLPRGQVMDEVDGFCNRWWLSKDCIGIDNDNAGTQCSVGMQYVDVLADLTFPFGPGNNYPALCTAANTGLHADTEEDNCAIANCEVDANFLRETFTHMSFNHLNVSLSMSFGFDTDYTCRGLTVGGATAAPFTTDGAATTMAAATTGAPATTSPIPNWDCCGDYPDRKPYRPLGGERACCDLAGSTYNTLTLMCCTNGAIAAINSCT